MRYLSAFFCFCTVTACESSAQFKSLDLIKIDEIGIDTTKEEFFKKYPKAVVMKDEDKQHGVSLYGIGNIDTTQTEFRFFNDRIIAVALTYRGEQLTKFGGSSKMLDIVTKLYGPVDSVAQADNDRTQSVELKQWTWKGKKSVVELWSMKKMMILSLHASEQDKALEQVKSKLRSAEQDKALEQVKSKVK